eukprot:905894_1
MHNPFYLAIVLTTTKNSINHAIERNWCHNDDCGWFTDGSWFIDLGVSDIICWNRFHRHDVQDNETRANPNENIVLSTEQRKPYEGKHFRITVNGIVQCKGDKCNNKAMVETTKWDPRCVECTNNYLKQKVWFCHNHLLGRNICEKCVNSAYARQHN